MSRSTWKLKPFTYFDRFLGHGGAEQYIRAQTLTALRRCATVMLWGCSSGSIHNEGLYGYSCTPMDYLVAGACVPSLSEHHLTSILSFMCCRPAVVASLWDVTDKDIDRCTLATLEHLGLPERRQTEVGDDTLAVALAKGREACTLRYLNGAAAVLYGDPDPIRCRGR